MLDWGIWVWSKLGEHSGPLEGLAVVIVLLGIAIFPVRWWWSRRQPPPLVSLANAEALLSSKASAPPPNTIQLDLDAFTALQRKLRDAARADIAAAHGEERKRLEDKIETLNARLRDPEEALAQQQAIITDLQEQLARRGNELGGDDIASAKAALKAGDFSQARKLFETLAARTAPEVTANADAEYALGQIAEAEIRWHDAYRHYKRAAELFDTLDHLSALARMTWRLAYAEESLKLQQRLCEMAKAEHGESSVEFSTQLNNLATIVQEQGRYSEAEALFRKALETALTTFGEDHPNYAKRLNNLALAVQLQGRYSEAEGLYRQALETTRVTIGAGHPNTATYLNNLATVVRAQGRYSEAEAIYRQALEIDRATIGDHHPDYGRRLDNLAVVMKAQGRYPEAEELSLQAMEIVREKLGEDHPDYAFQLSNLARAVEAQGRSLEAEELFRQALKVDSATIGEHHPFCGRPLAMPTQTRC